MRELQQIQTASLNMRFKGELYSTEHTMHTTVHICHFKMQCDSNRSDAGPTGSLSTDWRNSRPPPALKVVISPKA